MCSKEIKLLAHNVVINLGSIVGVATFTLGTLEIFLVLMWAL